MMAKQPNGWSEAELDILAKHYGTATKAQILALLPKRTWRAIKGMAYTRGNLTQRMIPWTAEQLETMRKHYEDLGAAVLAKMIGRTPVSVWCRAKAMGLKVAKKPAVKAEMKKAGPKPQAKNPTLSRPVEKPQAVPFRDMEGVITTDTKVTIAPPFVDRRWLVESAPNVIDSAQCRAWLTA